MDGDERARHCTVCNLSVYNFAEMTRDEVRALIVRSEGRVCARLYRRADGTTLTRDCPRGMRELRRRSSRAAAAIVAALLSLPAFALGAVKSKEPKLKTRGSKVSLTIEEASIGQPAVFTGKVGIDDGPLPGVTVTLRDEMTGREIGTRVTDADGAFTFVSLTDGVYRADLALMGFKPARIEHLELKGKVVTHASITMRYETSEQVVVGAIAVEPFGADGISTTFTQSFIDKLPQ